MADLGSVLVVTIVVMSAGSALYTLRTYMEPHMKVAINLAEANVKEVTSNGTLLEHSREILNTDLPLPNLDGMEFRGPDRGRNADLDLDLERESPNPGSMRALGVDLTSRDRNHGARFAGRGPDLEREDDDLERENDALLSRNTRKSSGNSRSGNLVSGSISGSVSSKGGTGGTPQKVLLESPSMELFQPANQLSSMGDRQKDRNNRMDGESRELVRAAVEQADRPVSKVEYDDTASEYEYIELPMGRSESDDSDGRRGLAVSIRDHTTTGITDQPTTVTVTAFRRFETSTTREQQSTTPTPTTAGNDEHDSTTTTQSPSTLTQNQPQTTLNPLRHRGMGRGDVDLMSDRRLTDSSGSMAGMIPRGFHEVDLIKIDRAALIRQKRTITQVRQGMLEGVEVDAIGKRVIAFLGVPYAFPPVGDFRFRRPKPALPWRGIRKAKSYGPPCLQYFPNNTDLPMNMLRKDISEDCLHLNVWTMSTEGTPAAGSGNGAGSGSGSGSGLQPVLLFLHGGAFTYGSNAVDEQDGRVLAAYSNLVVVTLNYRLGPLGFADGRSEEAPGNMGLHDMLMALKWIKGNIHAFGGDPDQVTIVGHQSGAMAASMFLLSPMARSLFRRAILQSGAATVFNVYYERSYAAFEQLAAQAGCMSPLTGSGSSSSGSSGSSGSSANSTANMASLPFHRHLDAVGRHGGDEHDTLSPVDPAVMACMRSLSIERLKRAADDQLSEMLYSYAPKTGDEINPLPFQKALETHHLGPQKEILIGSNADEGSLFLHLGQPDLFPRDRSPLASFATLDDAKAALGEALKDWGFTNATMHLVYRFFLDKIRSTEPRQLLKATYHSFGDLAFTCPTVYFAERFSGHGGSGSAAERRQQDGSRSADTVTSLNHEATAGQRSAYYYYFTHKSDAVRRAGAGDWLGAAHGDEIPYIFGLPLRYPYRYTGTDIDFSKSMMRIWSTFVRTGRPPRVNGREWPRYTGERPIYVELNGRIMKEGKMRTGTGPHRDNCDTWKYAYKLFND